VDECKALPATAPREALLVVFRQENVLVVVFLWAAHADEQGLVKISCLVILYHLSQ